MTGRPHPPRDVEFHLTMSEQDRELLDTLAHRMGVSRTETISRALHVVPIPAHQHPANIWIEQPGAGRSALG